MPKQQNISICLLILWSRTECSNVSTGYGYKMIYSRLGNVVLSGTLYHVTVKSAWLDKWRSVSLYYTTYCISNAIMPKDSPDSSCSSCVKQSVMSPFVPPITMLNHLCLIPTALWSNHTLLNIQFIATHIYRPMSNLIIVLGIHLVNMLCDNSILRHDIVSALLHNRVSSNQYHIYFHESEHNDHNIRFADLMGKLGNGVHASKFTWNISW